MKRLKMKRKKKKKKAIKILDILNGFPNRMTIDDSYGEVSERPKEHDWKSCFRRKAERGFKSRPLRVPLEVAQLMANSRWQIMCKR